MLDPVPCMEDASGIGGREGGARGGGKGERGKGGWEKEGKGTMGSSYPFLNPAHVCIFPFLIFGYFFFFGGPADSSFWLFQDIYITIFWFLDLLGHLGHLDLFRAVRLVGLKCGCGGSFSVDAVGPDASLRGPSWGAAVRLEYEV